MKNYEIIIIGGGPAGLAAAVAAYKKGTRNILIIERDNHLGGILNQCIHNGFGLHTFKEELTGPEYAMRFIEQVKALKITTLLNTMVMEISPEKAVTYMNGEEGIVTVQGKAIILAMGCRERSRGALSIPGYRPAGIYSAGMAQRLTNIEGYLPGKEVVILGSGDIGLIMARRLTLEGVRVKLVAEVMPFSGGLKRNIVQCLNDFGIPLKLSHTVVDIKGAERVEGVTIAEVDENMCPIKGTEEEYTCDTLLLSVGLIPENELSTKMNIRLEEKTNGPIVNERFETNQEGVFACGNVLHVHDLVDFVSEEASLAGRCAAEYVQAKVVDRISKTIKILAGEGISYTVPQKLNILNMDDQIKIRFRVKSIYQEQYISVYYNDKQKRHYKKRIMAPGEMEEIILKREDFENTPNLTDITIKVEEV